jgi:starch synthase
VGPVRIAFLSSEVAPFAKSGGLADVAFSLPKTLSKLGQEPRVFMPLYAQVDHGRHGLRPLGGRVEIRLLGQTVPFMLLTAELPGTATPIYFIDCPRFYDRPTLYTNDADEPLRFLYFSRAVLETCQRLGFAPDILHANDWQTALVPLLKKTLYAWDRLFQSSRTVLTIHNIAYQGVASAGVADAIGIDRSLFDGADLRGGRVNFLKTGIVHADRLTTVSPTYALEIQTEAQGYGLDPVLRSRARDLTGILNGVDYDEWDPSKDRFIPARYSARSLHRKKKNKEALLERLGLPYSEAIPLAGMVTRLSYQKGIEILFDALPAVLARQPLQLVVLGTGETKYEDFFEGLQARYPGAVRFVRGFDEELAHWIEAGADLFLMPSRYEPCGLNQMYSLRYGTVPVVRRTGGLADSVRPFDPATGEGTGIVFDHFNAEAVVWALEAGVGLFRDEALWRRVVLNGMKEDFSWDREAGRYLAIYRELLID